MLNPVKLLKVPDELVQLFYDLETDILKDIAERLVMNDFKLSPTSAYRLKKLNELGLHQDAVIKKIAAILKESEKKVKKAINDTSYQNIDSDNEMMKQHDLFSNANYDTGELRDIMLKGIRQTNGELRNITKSMAGAASKTYERALDNAYLKVRSGAYSYTEAIKSVVDDLASKGMETFTYKSGKHEQVSTVVRRAVLTGVNKTAIETQLANLSKMGMNLVRTTQHLGSRPTHEVWQGKTFYVGEPVEGYLSLEEGTGYGTGEGLGGWNCRHGIRIALEEMGIEYTEQPIDTEENNRIYELEQQQRYNERMIRLWKRRRDIKKAGGQDHSKESRKVKEWNARQDSFVKAHPELKRQMNRETAIKITGTKAGVINKLDCKNFDPTGLHGINERTILEVDKALTKIYKEYPQLKGIISEVKIINKEIADAEVDIQNQGVKISLGINKSLTPENANALTKRMYDQHKWTKKPGIDGIIRHEMGHVLNYDYYVRKNGLEYGKPYGDASLQRLIDDLKKNQLATVLRKETFEKLGIADTEQNIASYFSLYAKNKSMTNNGEFFAEAFSDYSDTNAKYIFMELLKERMK